MNPLFRLALALLATAFVAAGPAHAQIFRAYLSPTGSDSNPCTLPAPCRLVPAALNAVSEGGEIWMLEPANYNTGPVTIAKSVKIRAMPGIVASLITTNNQPAVSLAAGISVAFRGISFGTLANGTGQDGISATGAGPS